MSTVTLTPGDNLAAAFAGRSRGDKFAFAPGSYNFPSQILLPAGVELYALTPRTAKISGPTGGHAWKSTGDVVVRGFALVNNGLLLCDGEFQLIFDGNDLTGFGNAGNTGVGPGPVGGGNFIPHSSEVTNNYFHDVANGRSFYFYTCSGLKIWNNLFKNVMLGIKSNNANIRRSKQLSIRYNTFDGYSYHPIELQGVAEDFERGDNSFKNGSNPNGDQRSLFSGGSTIYTPGKASDPGGDFRSTRQHVFREKVVGVLGSNGNPVSPLADENGCDVVVEDCFFNNAAMMIFNAYGGGGAVQNNRIIGRYPNGIGYNYGGGTTPFVNNNADIVNTWDVNRPDPMPNWMTTGGTSSEQSTGNSGGSVSSTFSIAATADKAVSADGHAYATIAINNLPTGAAKISITQTASGNAADANGLVVAQIFSITGAIRIKGPWGFAQDVTAVVLDSAGGKLANAKASKVQFASDDKHSSAMTGAGKWSLGYTETPVDPLPTTRKLQIVIECTQDIATGAMTIEKQTATVVSAA